MFHTSIISSGELWLLVLPQVECTSAQMICVGKSAGEMGKTAAGVHEHTKTGSPPFFHCKRLAVWLNDRRTVWQFIRLVFLASCPGGGGKPEASVVKETPNLRGERQAYKGDQFESPYFDLWHPFFWIGEYCFFQKCCWLLWVGPLSQLDIFFFVLFIIYA